MGSAGPEVQGVRSCGFPGDQPVARHTPPDPDVRESEVTAMLKQMMSNSYLFGGNMPFVEEMYENYINNPASVPDNWRSYFDSLADTCRATARMSRIRRSLRPSPSAPSKGLRGRR